MSLFKTKEWWRTVCGANETFDGRGLLVAPLFGPEKKDVAIVSSHDGYLRLYRPSSRWNDESNSPSGYGSADLAIETKICECIVDTKVGKFVSGSQDLRLAVLTPTRLVVYNPILREDSTTEQEGSSKNISIAGERCDFEIAYEHALPRFPASLTTGPFGGVRGRDFLCVQCLDGTLLFYEQEVFAFRKVLRDRLFPEPIVYVSRHDLFVTAGSSWILECYRYQSMAESVGGNKERAEAERGDDGGAGGENLEPDWSYNIGEAVLDIDAVTLSSFEVGILVLGEKHLYCLKDGCASLRYAKRLDYKPLCFRAYVIEPDGKLMVLVIADTSTLVIYEGTTLKWSAQLPFPPVAIARAHFQHLQGAIVVLSEDGRLEVSYLGSEPALFVAPPLHRRAYDYEAAERELSDLRSILERRSSVDGDPDRDATTENELVASVNVSSELQPCPRVLQVGSSSKDDGEERQSMCSVAIELSTYANLRDVQISMDARRPLLVTERSRDLPNLRDRHVVRTNVYLDGEAAPISSEIEVTVTYRTDRGNLRVLRKTAPIPLKMMLRSCPPESSTAFATTIKCSESLVSFTQLFPEFTGDHVRRENSNAMGLRHARSGRVVTVVSGTASNRYRVQSNDGLSTTLVLGQLIDRLRDKATARPTASIGQNHMELVHSRIEAHFLGRREIDAITNEIGLLTIQLRIVERRMLRAVRERNSRSLPDTGLPFLLDSTYRAIFALLEDLARAKSERERTGHDLGCALKLLLLLLRLNAKDDKYAIAEAAIGLASRPSDRLDWEEITDVALTSVLRSISRKSGTQETKPFASNRMTTSKDLAKLKKRLVHAVERLDGCRLESDIAEAETSDGNDLASV